MNAISQLIRFARPSGITKATLALLFFLLMGVQAFGQFVHPGISHKISDLERMKIMIEAGVEPWASSFQELRSHSRAQFTRDVGVLSRDPSFVIEFNEDSDGFLINDSTTAYLNALMWYFTGDSRHAEKAIEVFNAYTPMRRNTEIPLVSGRIVRLIEAAEIIKHTYDGWDPVEMQEFKDMLVYPGYSSTTVPQSAINSRDISFYWKVYNGDPSRIGNQGLLAARLMMSMGIFLDNELMYDRAVRMLRGQVHNPNDVPFQSGPAINGSQDVTCDFYEQHALLGFESTIPDFGFNEVIGHYIYDNGQCQEADRDQAHTVVGISSINALCEIAWSQGDDLYSTLDNRPLLGMEYYLRYNLVNNGQNSNPLDNNLSFPDQPEPWEPTVDSGEFMVHEVRNGRRVGLKINPGVNCNQDRVSRGETSERPVYELPLAHYRDRMGLPGDDFKWLTRAHDHFSATVGTEGITTTIAFPMYGSLFFRRVSPGDPISGFDSNGLPQYAMNMLPGTVEAENFDYFTGDGQGRTYGDTTPGNQGEVYRFDSDVDIQETTEGDTYVGSTGTGEFLTYTVSVPQTGIYTIRARVSTSNDTSNVRMLVDGEDQTGEVPVPNTGGSTNFTNVALANSVRLPQGVHQVRVDIMGEFTLDSFSIAEPIAGDFNGDSLLNCADLDGFVENIGEPASGSLATLDLNLNGVLDFSDANLYLSFVVQTSNGVTGTFPGDFDCDGQVTVVGDAFALVSNLGGFTTRYSDGDVNFDGSVDVVNDAFVLIANLGRSNE